MGMFFDHISDSDNNNQLFLLNSHWCINLPGLVRVPFFDRDNPNVGYVVYYSETKQEYGIVKYLTEDGSLTWTKAVCNGGYGTPVVFGNLLICHKEFDSVVAIDKERGDEMWDIKTHGRIRTSISSYGGFCYFATVGLIYKIDSSGHIINSCDCKGAFFYGNIVKYDKYILVLGVEYNQELHKSCLSLYYFDLDLTFVDKIILSNSPVISSDTSGLFCIEKYALITCYDEIYKIDIVNHSVLFNRKLEGIAGRHIPISDGVNIYYTTLNGYVSAVSLENASVIWRMKMNECSIVAPPSLKGQSLFILADGCLNVINKLNGNIIQKKVIGHAPYSAAILFDNRLYVGGGEPPMYGNLISFNLVNEKECQPELFEVKILNGDIDDRDKTILIRSFVHFKSVEINPSAIATEDTVMAKHCGDDLFRASFKLKNNCIRGFYGIPIRLVFPNNEGYIDSMFRLELQSMSSLPTKVFLQDFAKPIKQEDDLFSGAALAQLLMGQYGKSINQKDFRNIIDYVKSKSEWKDADFQTWRLILKRVLSNPHNTLDDFIQSEEE